MSHTIARSAALLAMTLATLFGGCMSAAGPDGNPDPGSSPDDTTMPEGAAAVKEADMQLLKQAGQRYAALRVTQSAIDARNALVDELNNTAGVTSAGLAEDNYTVVVAFDDGSRAAINTIEGFGAGTPYDAQSMANKVGAAMKQSDSARKTDDAYRAPGPGDLLHTPASRKILFISAATEDLGGADTDLFDGMMTKLVIDHHWDTTDFTIKTNKQRDDYATLRFGDFFNLSDYGVVVIVAHGIYMNVTRTTGTTAGSTPDPTAGGSGAIDPADPFNFGFKAIRSEQTAAATRTPHYFIQVAAAGPVVSSIVGAGSSGTPSTPGGDKSDPFSFGFKQVIPEAKIDGVDVELETTRGRLVVVSHVSADTATARPYYYMRDDLWKEHISTVPNSLVYIASPSAYADPDAAWPDVGPAPGGTDPIKDSDPFNFGFKQVVPPHKTAASGAGLVFEGTGAGTLLAWTGAVDTQTALDAAWLMRLMAGRNESDREVWNSGDIVRKAARAGVPRAPGAPAPSGGASGDPAAGGDPYGFGFKSVVSTTMQGAGDGFARLALHSKTDRAFLYLPTWADVEVLAPIPDGTSAISVALTYEDTMLPDIDPATLTGGTGDTFSYDGLLPGRQVTVTAQALDASGNPISEYENTLTLQSGGNPIDVSFARELSVTLSGSPDTSGDWGDREDLSNPHMIPCTGCLLLIHKNGELLSSRWIRLTQNFSSQLYPPLHVISHDKILSYSGRNPAYPGDIIKLEMIPEANDGMVSRLGPLYLHYWNDAMHEVIPIGTMTGTHNGPHVFETVTLGK